MSVNFENLYSYEALEEILKWKRTKSKSHKVKDRLDAEINKINSFKRSKNGKPNKRK